MSQVDDYLQKNRKRFEQDLIDFLRIPSVSAQQEHAADVASAAEWLLIRFGKMGIEAQLLEGDGHPVVYAETQPVEGAPVVMVYGHYDVQPPDPVEDWTHPPFEPVVEDGSVFARGASDDKGQVLTHVNAAEAWLETKGKLPVQLKFVIEGEEEVGSHLLFKYLSEEPEKMACDVIVVSDSIQLGPGQPAITYGLRGIVAFELTLQGPNRELHSGAFGGAVTNPVNTLCKIMSALTDENNRVTLPDFYEDIPPLSDKERRQLAALPFNEAGFRDKLGVTGTSGENGYSLLERRWARPTFDINGMFGGYQGQGIKTVLPPRATAKFSFRLVPDQDPDKIADSLRTMIEGMLPPGVEMTLNVEHGAAGVVMSPDNPYLEAAARAIEHGFGRSPLFIREGGSIPIMVGFREALGADLLLLGWGLDDDRIHAPNEKFCLKDYFRGTKSSARLLQELKFVSREE